MVVRRRKSIQLLLKRMNSGDALAAGEVYAVFYEELKKRALGMMHVSTRDTLQPTALVNEAYLRLKSKESTFEDGHHFLACAANAMRSVLVDYARIRSRWKRLPPRLRVELNELAGKFEGRSIDLLSLDEALRELQELDPSMSKAVELRFFGGLSMGEIAEILGRSKRSLERDWAHTRAWLLSKVT